MYGVVFVLSRVVFAVSIDTSALAALVASAPAVPFMGPAILGHLFGQSSAIPIAIASLVINLTVVPATILLLSLDPDLGGRQETHRAAPVEEPHRTVLSAIAGKLGETVREPLVWAPVAAFAVVLSGVTIPPLLFDPLSLLGHATGASACSRLGLCSLPIGSMPAFRSCFWYC